MHAISEPKDHIAMLRKIAAKTGSKVAKGLVKERDYDAECSVACQLFYEAMDAFKEGDMSWKEAIDDLHENLKAIDVKEKKV